VSSFLAGARVLKYAGLSGFQDYATMFTLKSWLLGWFLRVLAQVTFFALIGELIGSTARLHFILVGNAVMLASMEAMGAVPSTTWERRAGTFPLLIAGPTSPVVVLMGRSVQWLPSGVASATGAFFLLGPLFGLEMPFPRVLLVVPLIVLVALSTYMLGTFLGALVLRAMEARNLVFNISFMTLMAMCGVNVPLEFYPEPILSLAQVLPLTHGLLAIRGVLESAPASEIVLRVGLEAGVGAFWLVMALLAFRRYLEAVRRDGSIEFAA
jgi:ABC-2 type transport system permease protein